MHIKKTTLFFASIAIISVTLLFDCQSPEKKVENAQNDLQLSKTKVLEAQNELSNSKTEFLEFKKESEERIKSNDKRIAEFNSKIENVKIENKAVYKKDIAWLEQKNIDLKTKLDSYQDEGKENWGTFRAEFAHDMDELGKAFNDFTVINLK